MPQKNVFLIIDTETADLQGHVYDVGFTVADKSGHVFTEFTALVEETFTDAKKMMGAFYARKLFTHYARMLQDGVIRLVPWNGIIAAIRDACIAHDVTVVAAYNLAFDRRVLRQTNKMLGATQPVLPYKMKMLDLWQFACETKLNTATYKRLAREQGWVSDAGNLRSGAEYAYRFCSGDWGFIEDHTALSDARIETQIMAACFATKKRIPYDVVGSMPWKLIQEKAA